jgi:hypothetical protein
MLVRRPIDFLMLFPACDLPKHGVFMLVLDKQSNPNELINKAPDLFVSKRVTWKNFHLQSLRVASVSAGIVAEAPHQDEE